MKILRCDCDCNIVFFSLSYVLKYILDTKMVITFFREMRDMKYVKYSVTILHLKHFSNSCIT